MENQPLQLPSPLVAENKGQNTAELPKDPLSSISENLQAYQALLPSTSFSNLSTMQTWITEQTLAFKSLSEIEKLSEQGAQLRIELNETIAKYNEAAKNEAISTGEITPNAGILVGKPQVEKKRRSIAVRSSIPPGLPHNDLAPLSIFRDKNRIASPELSREIVQVCEETRPQDEYYVQTVTAITLSLPNNLINGNISSTPQEFRDVKSVARDVVGLVTLVENYRLNRIPIPSQLEIATATGQEQEELLTQYLTALTVHQLNLELLDPNRSEKDFSKQYQQMNTSIKDIAELISVKYSDEGMEKIGETVIKLPSVIGAMLTSRMSNELHHSLGFPRADLMSEERFAKHLRDTSHTRDGVRFELALLIETLADRAIEGEDLNVNIIFAQLEDLDYGESAIKDIFSNLDSDQRDILFTALRFSGCFRDLIPYLHKKIENNEDF